MAKHMYTITASRPIGGGRSENLSSETTLGHAHGQTYETREAAEEDVAYLVSTWDADWGECPVYEVEEQEQEDLLANVWVYRDGDEWVCV